MFAVGKQVADAALQQGHPEGFDDVFVCSGFEAFFNLHAHRAGGEEDKQDVTQADIFFYEPAKFQTTHAGHHDVADNHVRQFFLYGFQGFLSVAGCDNVIRRGQVLPEVGQNIPVVFYYQNFVSFISGNRDFSSGFGDDVFLFAD